MTETIGIVGLGRMGMPAAKALINAGYRVVAHDCRVEAMDEIVSAGGETASDYKTVARKAQTVIVFVLNDPQVIEVVTGPRGLLAGAGNGSVVVCMATIRKDNLIRVAERCRKEGVAFVDCPCTGGPARAENGTLTLIAAAENDLMDRCRPMLETLGAIVHVGETPGMGQAVKHCNQHLVSTIHAATMEVILMAKKSGLDVKQVCEVVGSGVGGNDYFRMLSKSVLEGTPAPCELSLMCKDSNIVVDTGRQMKLPLMVATAANQYFLAGESLGLEKEESSILMQVVERFSQPDDNN
jgi:3-hydroxyisobutyrate dehydrogenase-like beta-hydroxyacid dehydrogenase